MKKLKTMNKFKIIAIFICSVISFIFFAFFDIESKWYYTNLTIKHAFKTFK